MCQLQFHNFVYALLSHKNNFIHFWLGIMKVYVLSTSWLWLPTKCCGNFENRDSYFPFLHCFFFFLALVNSCSLGNKYSYLSRESKKKEKYEMRKNIHDISANHKYVKDAYDAIIWHLSPFASHCLGNVTERTHARPPANLMPCNILFNMNEK